MAGPGSTEVYQGREILLLSKSDPAAQPGADRLGDRAIERGRGHFDGMARQDAGVEAVEPTGVQIVPGAVLDDHVVVDTVARRLAEGPVCDLIHADRARRRLVPLKRIPRKMPAPVGPRHRIARSLRLRQRRQQLGGDDRGRMFAEERAVFLPGFDGTFVEGPVQGKEDFARLVERVIGPVDAEPQEEKEDGNHDGPHRRRRLEHGFHHSTKIIPPCEQKPPEGSDRLATPALRSAAGTFGGVAIGTRGHEGQYILKA